MSPSPALLDSGWSADRRVPLPNREQFTRLDMMSGSIYIEVQVPAPAPDPLGFNYERMRAGEADADAGRVRPFADVMNALRARIRRNSR